MKTSVYGFAFLAVLFVAQLFVTQSAFAGDEVTIVLEEGQVARSEFGFKQLSEEFKRLSSKTDGHFVVELSNQGGTFFVDLAKVVMICRDDCSHVEFTDPRAKKK